MKNFGTVIDNFDAVTKQYVDNKVPTDEHIKGIKVDNATLADTAKKVQNAFTYKAHNKAAGTVVPITYDGSEAASLDFGANDFTYDYSSGKDIKVKLVDKGYATSVKINGNTIASSGGVVDLGTVLTDASKFATSAQGSNADSALTKANANATEISNIKNGTTKVKSAEHADTADSATSAGTATKATEAMNVTENIKGHAIADIFESDGTTVKKATSAGTADKVANGLTLGGGVVYDGSKALSITAGNKISITGGPGGVSIGLAHSVMPSTYNKVTVDGYGTVTAGENVDYLTSHQSIKKLNTNNTTAQDANASEAIAGSGTINLHKVAKTGSYNDLLYKPTIPAAANNGKLTIQKNGTDVQTFTANQSSSVTANITVPTKASDVNALSLDGGTINKSKTIQMDASANSDGANLKWGTVNSKNPYIGYASDQVDGTFVVGSLLGTNYASGLAIGGGSGNLLWKGTKVATTSDIPTNYVTTDTTQTISGAKTFTSDVVVNKATPKFNMKLSGLTNGTTPSANQFGEVCFVDKNGVYEGGIRFDSPTNGENRTKLSTNSFGTTHSNYVGLFAKKNASSATAKDIWRFIPNQDAVIDLGQSDLRWRNVRAVTTYSNVYGSDLCSTSSLRLKDPNITRGTNQAASGGKQNYYRAININDKNNKKGVGVEWGYLCEKNSSGNTTKHVSELNLLVYPPNTTDNANFVKVALGKRSDGTTYFTYAGDQVITTKNFSLSGTTLTITL